MTTEQINRPCPILKYRPFQSPGQIILNLDQHDVLIIDPDAVREQTANILFTINTLLEVASITSVLVPVKTRLQFDTSTERGNIGGEIWSIIRDQRTCLATYRARMRWDGLKLRFTSS